MSCFYQQSLDIYIVVILLINKELWLMFKTYVSSLDFF